MSTFFVAAASCSLATTLMFSAGADDGWRNLKYVTRDRVYAVIFRDGHCAQGAIVNANRFEPLTRWEEHVHRETVNVLAPRLWFNYPMLGTISVLLYNSELAEDNSPTGCQQR
jgi:hypothetical protein